MKGHGRLLSLFVVFCLLGVSGIPSYAAENVEIVGSEEANAVAEEVASDYLDGVDSAVQDSLDLSDSALYATYVAEAEAIQASKEPGEEYTEEELAILRRPGELVFGDPQALEELWASINEKPIAENCYQLATGIGLEEATGSAITPMASKTGVYPARKGVVIVTGDAFKGLIPTGHAGIIYEGSGEHGIVESLQEGVVYGLNNWNKEKTTCYAVDVNATSNYQETLVADWCAAKVGAPYNINSMRNPQAMPVVRSLVPPVP